MPYENVPEKLKSLVRFCVWDRVNRDGKITKIPINPITGRAAKTDKPETFASYGQALKAAPKHSGIGFRVSDGVTALDLDHCFNDDGTLKHWALDVADHFKGTYMERSPSGTGMRIIFLAEGFEYDKKKYYINNQRLGLEVYVSGATNRFVTLTGNVYQAGELAEMKEALQKVLDKYMIRPSVQQKKEASGESVSYLSDESVISKAAAAADGEKFKNLWSGNIDGYASQSEADLALCSKLGFWCSGDMGQIDRLFRESALYREKWDRPQSSSTYGSITIEKALSGLTEFYKPGGKRSSPEDDFNIKLPLAEFKPAENSRYEWNDIGSGNLFADVYKDVLCYVPERRSWFWYDGTRWKHDVGGLRAMERCKRLFEQLMVYAFGIKDERRRTEYLKYVIKWSARHCRETILKDAQGVYPVSMSEFDKDLFLFNCLNGTYDLKTKKFREHRASDKLTKISGVNYNPEAKCARWEPFVDEVMSGDRPKSQFLQKSFGYALSGDTSYECMFILYGPTTRNGKGTLMETFLRLMGDYGITVRPDTIASKTGNNGSAPSEDIARLAGARFANISEPDKKLTLNTALVKSMVGNDSMNARYLHENSFDFRPQFKLFINCNSLPTVIDITLFSSDRVKIIPFERHFEVHERDTSLKSHFARPENLSGIFNWCIEGLRLLEREGLDMPESVRMATSEYRQASDKIGLFIEDCMNVDGTSEVRTAMVYTEYRVWCAENGYYAESIRNFNASLGAKLSIVRKRPSPRESVTTVIIGARLLTGFERS